MNKFTLSTLNTILKKVDYDNDMNFDSFIESLLGYFKNLEESDLNELLLFLEDDLKIYSDLDLCGMSRKEITDLHQFISDTIAV